MTHYGLIMCNSIYVKYKNTNQSVNLKMIALGRLSGKKPKGNFWKEGFLLSSARLSLPIVQVAFTLIGPQN